MRWNGVGDLLRRHFFHIWLFNVQDVLVVTAISLSRSYNRSSIKWIFNWIRRIERNRNKEIASMWPCHSFRCAFPSAVVASARICLRYLIYLWNSKSILFKLLCLADVSCACIWTDVNSERLRFVFISLCLCLVALMMRTNCGRTLDECSRRKWRSIKSHLCIICANRLYAGLGMCSARCERN